MKAYRYLDETMGAEYDVEEIPADLLEEAKHQREHMIEKVAEAARSRRRRPRCTEKFVGGETPTVAEIKAAIRKATIAMTLFPVICGSRLQEQGRAADARRVVDYLPVAARHAADDRATTATRGELVERAGQGRRAVLARSSSRS